MKYLSRAVIWRRCRSLLIGSGFAIAIMTLGCRAEVNSSNPISEDLTSQTENRLPEKTNVTSQVVQENKNNDVIGVTKLSQDEWIEKIHQSVLKSRRGQEGLRPYFDFKFHEIPKNAKFIRDVDYLFKMPLSDWDMSISMPSNWYLGHYAESNVSESGIHGPIFIPGLDRYNSDNFGLSFYTPHAFLHLYSDNRISSVFRSGFFEAFNLRDIASEIQCETDVLCDISDELSKIDLAWAGKTRFGLISSSKKYKPRRIQVLQKTPAEISNPVIKFIDQDDLSMASRNAYTTHVNGAAIHIQSLDEQSLTAEDIWGALRYIQFISFKPIHLRRK